MGATTEIAWTDATFNPWWGCQRVSPGCDHCYAETFSRRTGHDGLWAGGHRFFGDRHWAEPLRWPAGARVFCASMCDVFEPGDDLDEQRDRLWALIEATPHLTWQLLTKRPEQVRAMVPSSWLDRWPGHVWLGVTCEDGPRARLRLPRLADIPAPVRFVSYEPALGPIAEPLGDVAHAGDVDWVIVGGESGPGHRPFDLDWLGGVAVACAICDVPLFVKQDSGPRPGQQGRIPDRLWARKEFPS